ncbi:MAG: anthranilate phosphoribosyltransferase [Sulfurimonas sp.]|nr:MAG: anthranilate phosphoribosyltransferase [Sulfurimonas sp.]
MSYREVHKQFESLFSHEMSDEQMQTFLRGMPLDATTPTATIAAAAEVMRSHALTLEVSAQLQGKLIDIVGTGGDKSGSFNISTTTSIVVASCGAYVAKHGNRSVTSKSGSADVLEALGVRLNLNLAQTTTMLQECGFCFMFAQNHHPAMKFIMPIRKSIREKTVFNVLGPLTNPAGVQKFLLGVFDKSFVPKIAEVLKRNGATSAMVVSAAEGMDEISISGITYAALLKANQIDEFEIDPQRYGIAKVPFDAVLGGDAQKNAAILHNILNNKASDAQRDIVRLNAAAALLAEGMARDLQEGLQMASEALLSGKARAKLHDIISVSKRL